MGSEGLSDEVNLEKTNLIGLFSVDGQKALLFAVDTIKPQDPGLVMLEFPNDSYHLKLIPQAGFGQKNPDCQLLSIPNRTEKKMNIKNVLPSHQFFRSQHERSLGFQLMCHEVVNAKIGPFDWSAWSHCLFWTPQRK